MSLNKEKIDYLLSFVLFGKVDDNMARAHRRDAVNQQSFWFRPSIQREFALLLISNKI
jgi:hypothetical protein